MSEEENKKNSEIENEEVSVNTEDEEEFEEKRVSVVKPKNPTENKEIEKLKEEIKREIEGNVEYLKDTLLSEIRKKQEKPKQESKKEEKEESGGAIFVLLSLIGVAMLLAISVKFGWIEKIKAKLKRLIGHENEE